MSSSKSRFLLDENVRFEPLPSSDPFTDEEWKKIRKLAARGPVSGFSGSKESLKELKAWLRLP